MRTNFFKYIFILFVLFISVFAIYTIYFKEENKPNENLVEEVVEDKQEIKDLRLGISNFDTINPLLSNNKEVLNIGRLIFEPLITINQNYQAELCLASECSKTSPTSYVIKIDNKKKWQDGSSLISKDIQFTIDRLKEGKSAYSYNVERVESVEILDESTVKINLFEEIPFFEYNLTFPIMSNNYYLGEDFNNSSKIPIGTGMFKISEIDGSNVKLSKNEKWWNIDKVNPKVEKISIKLYSEIGELYNSFKLGNIDLFTSSNLNLQNYIGTIGYKKIEFKGRQFDYLAFNCQDKILKNAEVRKAILSSIDKNNIVSSIYNNQYYISDFPLDYGNFLYTKGEVNNVFNPEQAKQILANNGWEYKYNRWQKKDGYRNLRLNLTLSVNSSNGARTLVAENIKTSLEQIGIKVTINKLSDSAYKSALENKNYQMILTGVYNSYSPNIEAFFGNNNLQNYNNEEVNRLLSEVETITDANLLKEKYNRIVQIYEEERPFIGLYRNKQTIVKSQNLAGEVLGNNYFSYYKIEDWYRF